MDSSQDTARTTLCDEEKFKEHSDIDTEDSYPSIHHPTRSRFLRPAIISLSIIAVLIPIIYLTASYQKTPKYNQCGTTADEARARGCVFETTGFTWLPRPCHDAQTEEEFLQHIVAHELSIYRDANYTDIVPIPEVRLGNGPGFFVRQQYHVTHCLFLLKKLHRASASGKVLDGQIMPTHHTEHCVEMALKPPGFRKDAVQLSYTKFPYCGKPGGFDVGWDQKHGRPSGWIDY
ncbi:hypothetical protein CC80DRAFT_490246 [Byssothecium circinans]|uniref:Uncharacterized protein n=1 Tax=Byssothecium circinans TaxID=147558 RepID=A0A6A5U4M8_9PLEO|nr:hypothetical protein CC80DRAFT_490246 [Byssothecium circinans]